VSGTKDRTEEFVRLYAANQRRIYGFVTSILPRPTDADDVFQEISASLWQKFHEFRPGTDFTAWSLQFARYAILKYYRAQRNRGRLVFGDDVVESLIDESASAILELDRRQEALHACLGRLPERSRELIRIRYETDASSCRDAASRTGRSLEAVYKSLRRIHELLLRCIERVLAAEDRA
jgi:RNA polymerase sigma-70 factor, ECF subfamily